MTRQFLRLISVAIPIIAVAQLHSAPPLPRLLSGIAQADFIHCSLAQLPTQIREYLKDDVAGRPDRVQYGFELYKRDLNRDGQKEWILQTPFGGEGSADFEIFQKKGSESKWLGFVFGFAPIGLREFKNGYYQLSTHSKSSVSETYLNLFAFDGSYYCHERSDSFKDGRYVRTRYYDLSACK